jgi:Tol biopolymer transport system component/imidazolonepropionase-like amidohydrolase
MKHLRASLFIAFVISLSNHPLAQEERDEWDTTKARGATRDIEFSISEGTWMSASTTPDEKWIVFDLLAHIYRMPAGGGEAECLTADSGVALNFHPRVSPDGKTIAFVSDRKGQNNLWLMDIDGKNPRAVFTNRDVRVFEPAWSPDGNWIVVRRQEVGSQPQPAVGIWMYHRNGGSGTELVGREARGAAWPTFSPDGQYVYFHQGMGSAPVSGHADVLSGAFQIRRVRLEDGHIEDVTSGLAGQQSRTSNGGAIAAELSPDGRYMTFARRLHDQVIEYKGHKFGPRTALWLRDNQTGSEKMLLDPIEVDMIEGMKTWRALPGYHWSKDGTSIVISQGGKLKRLDVASGRVTDVPFTAKVKRTISEMAYKAFEIPDGPFEVKFARWHTASPDGKTLAFQAVGRIYVMDLPSGTPRRLTPETFTAFEFAPAWSPDGRSIAFTTWDDKERGALWKTAASGGAPQKLTTDAAEYVQPTWTPDGQQVVVSRGAGETARGRTFDTNAWFDLVRVPANGGAPAVVTRVDTPGGTGRAQIVKASFAMVPVADSQDRNELRMFFHEETLERPNAAPGPGNEMVFELKSIRLDGLDERVHLRFPYADEIAVSPDAQWVAFQEGDNVFLTGLPLHGTGKEPLKLEKRRGKIFVDTLSKEGGMFPRWRTASVVEYGSGPSYFTYDINSKKTDKATIKLTIPRKLPSGSIALTNARILTMENRKVIERGTLVTKGGRIACVGQCSTAGAERVIDARGKTIVPGYIDMHAHHYRQSAGITPANNYENAIYLAYGVTTNLDNSMWSENVFPTAEMVEAGLTLGPRAFSTGDPLYRGDGSRQNEITSYDVAEQNITRLQSWGAVSVKQYLQPHREQRQWISDVARKKGLMVTAEGDSLEYNLSMIMDGQTAWEHPLSYMPLYADATTFFGMAKAVYSPTFIVGGPAAWNEEYFWQETDLWKDEKAKRWLPWQQLVPHTRRRIVRPETDYSFPLIAQAAADIIAKGGYAAIGSHGQQHGIGSHWEIWMAASALGPMGALEVATVHGAHFLGASKDLGSIGAGKIADVVVLNSNPLDNIRNTQDIRWVMKSGVLYDGMTLEEIKSAPGARPRTTTNGK